MEKLAHNKGPVLHVSIAPAVGAVRCLPFAGSGLNVCVETLTPKAMVLPAESLTPSPRMGLVPLQQSSQRSGNKKMATYKKVILGMEMVQWVKDLQHKHGDLSLDPRNP